MIINRLYLKSFGKFKDKEITLSDGLNIIYGPNEAGKSTIQKFIEGMFFGFKKPYKSRRIFTNEHQSCKPWNSDTYCGVLEYEHRGKKYQIERDFNNDDFVIRDALTGENINKLFKQHKGTKEYNFTENHMNINKNVFSNTISISQGNSVSSDELSKEVSSKLSNLSYSGNADISIRRACMELEKVLREEVGSERAPKSPIGLLTKQINQLEEEKAKIESILSKVRHFEVMLAENRPLILENLGKKREKEAEIKSLNDYLLAKKLKSIEEQEEKICKINKYIYELERYRYFPVHQKERIIEIKEAIKNLENNLKEVNLSLQKQREIRRQPQKYLEKHDYLRDLDMESAASISRDYALYQSFQEQIEQKKKLLQTTERSLNEIKNELNKSFWENGRESDLYKAEKLEENITHLRNSSLKNKIDMLEEKKALLHNQLKTFKTMMLVIFTLAGTILVPAVLFNSLFALLMMLPALLSVNWWKRILSHKKEIFSLEQEMEKLINMDCEEQEKIEVLENRLHRILKQNEVETPRDLRVKLSQYTVLIRENDRLEREFRLINREYKDLINRYHEFKDDITSLLKSASLWDNKEEINDQKIEEFKNRLSNYQSTFNLICNIDEKIMELEASRDKIEKELYELKEESEYLFISAGVKNFDEYFTGCRKHREIEILLEQRQKHEELLQTVLEGVPLYELKKVDLSHLDKMEINEDINKDLISKKRKELDRINEDLSKTKSKHAELEAKIETTFSGFRPPAEIDEELSQKKEEKAYLLEQAEALRIAIKMIDIVARDIHRDFAPKLNEKVSELISRITNDRYKQVKISKNLDITVMVPETGKHVNIHDLSGGTIDQFYFSARVMIADLVTGNSNLPLILDDSFVQYDWKRLCEVLKNIVELSKKRQIIFFTCHSREIDLLREIKGKFKLINLEEPKILFLDLLQKKTEKV